MNLEMLESLLIIFGGLALWFMWRLEQENRESIRLLSLCLAHLRTTDHKADYESACRLCGVKPYEQEEPK